MREEHIERLIHSERGQAQVKHFAFIWLQAYGLLSAYQLHQDKNVNEDVYDAMMEEVSHLVKHVFYTPSAPFSDLLSADYTFLNSTLADYYGIPSNSDNPNDFVQTDTDERGGILTTGLFTIGDKATAIPIGKALFVRRNLLCQTFPPEPSASEEIKQQIASVIDPLYEQGLLTPTKYYELAGDHLSCDSCHRYAISPLFALDDFDYQGLPRKRVAGKVVAKGLGPNGKEGLIVDAIDNGRLYGIETLPTTGQEPFIPFYGSKDLGRKLAEQEHVKQCFVQNLTNFAAGSYHAGRITEASADIYKAFTEAGDDPMAAYKAIGHSSIIRLRQK